MSSSTSSSRACYSAICRTSSGTWSIRARATAGCRFPLNASRASAHFQSTPVTSFERVIAAFLPLRRRLREPVEHCGPFKLRAPAFFSSRGPSLLTREFLPAQVLAGRVFSFLRTLVEFCQEPTSGVFHRFQFSPVLLSVPTNHAHKKAWSYEHVVQRKSVNGA